MGRKGGWKKDRECFMQATAMKIQSRKTQRKPRQSKSLNWEGRRKRWNKTRIEMYSSGPRHHVPNCTTRKMSLSRGKFLANLPIRRTCLLVMAEMEKRKRAGKMYKKRMDQRVSKKHSINLYLDNFANTITNECIKYQALE